MEAQGTYIDRMVLAGHVGEEKSCWGLKYGGAIGGSKGPAATNNNMFVPRDIDNVWKRTTS